MREREGAQRVKRCVHCGSTNGQMISAPGGGHEHWPTFNNAICLGAVRADVRRLEAENEHLQRRIAMLSKAVESGDFA